MRRMLVIAVGLLVVASLSLAPVVVSAGLPKPPVPPAPPLLPPPVVVPPAPPVVVPGKDRGRHEGQYKNKKKKHKKHKDRRDRDDD